MKDVAVAILAAGKGTRIREVDPNKPKVMLELGGRPICSYIVNTLNGMRINPYLLIGYMGEQLQSYFGKKCNYIWQRRRLGTGHAAKLVLNGIDKNYKKVMILQGDDSAFYTKETLTDFVNKFRESGSVCAFMTVKSNDKSVGRVIRDGNGRIVDIIEKENLKPEHLKFDEINAGGYIFDVSWAKKNITKLKKHMPKGEYYLPDLIKIALEKREKVLGYLLPEGEWFGINTPEQLEDARKILK